MDQEIQIPLYLEKQLQDIGIMQSPKLSEQDELESPYTVQFSSFGYEVYDEDGDILF